ncbi:surfeit locus protein [Phlyctochytrium planicorne]|nr:surfeit locus protein [Phlyctochytrium planicorne]
MVDESRKRLISYEESFNALINLIPLKHYLPPDDEDASWNKFAHNKKNKAPKQEIKESTKRAKKMRLELDPAAQKTFSDIQAEKAEKVAEKTSNGKAKLTPLLGNGVAGDHSLTVPEIRDKVRMKIAEMKASREKRTNPSKEGEGTAVVATPRSRQEILEKRLKRRKEKQEKRKSKSKPKDASDLKNPAPTKAKEETDTENISFGKINIGQTEKSSKKGSGDAKSLLKKAENKAKKLEAIKAADPDIAKAIVDSQKWGKLMKQAEGKVVKDDIKLLKKTVKKKDKLKSKSAKDWDSRTSSVAKAQAERQKRRNENLKARTENKGKGGKVKKAARPGFEGGSRKKTTKK